MHSLICIATDINLHHPAGWNDLVSELDRALRSKALPGLSADHPRALFAYGTDFNRSVEETERVLAGADGIVLLNWSNIVFYSCAVLAVPENLLEPALAAVSDWQPFGVRRGGFDRAAARLHLYRAGRSGEQLIAQLKNTLRHDTRAHVEIPAGADELVTKGNTWDPDYGLVILPIDHPCASGEVPYIANELRNWMMQRHPGCVTVGRCHADDDFIAAFNCAPAAEFDSHLVLVI